MKTETYKRRLDAIAKRSDQTSLPTFTIAWIEAENGAPTGRYYLTESGSEEITGPFTGDTPKGAIEFDTDDMRL